MAITDVLGFAGNAGPKGTLGDAATTGDARRFIGAGEDKQAVTGEPVENLEGQRQYNLAKAEYDAWKMRQETQKKAIAGAIKKAYQNNPNRG